MKLTKIIAAGLSALMCFPLFAACGEQTETVYQAATELSYYDGTHYEELADPYKPYYNKELWRRNSSDLSGADPLVLDNTSRDGYYYAYVTGLTYSRSKDLVTWESGGSFVSFPEELSGSDALWAPEVIYDEEDELYYAFFTVNPPADKAAGEGESAPYYMPIVATSEKASGPFVPVSFDDRNTGYPQSYAKYALFDNAAYKRRIRRRLKPPGFRTLPAARFIPLTADMWTATKGGCAVSTFLPLSIPIRARSISIGRRRPARLQG